MQPPGNLQLMELAALSRSRLAPQVCLKPPPCPTAGLCPLLSLFKSLIRELRCSQPALEVPRHAWASSSEQLLLISGFDPVARVSWKCLSS